MASKFQPYVGPRPFEGKDQEAFFGRDYETGELLSLVIAHDMVLLYAQSGAGKTSLLNASLIPRLKEEGIEVLPIARVGGRIPEGMKPKDVPNIPVFNSLMSLDEDEIDRERLSRMTLSAFLAELKHPTSKEGLRSPRVVIFDQFEELFTSYPDRWQDREGFFRQVAEALEADPLLRVLFVIREDYLASLDPYVDLLPERLRMRYRLELLREKAAWEAVEKPLQNTEPKRTFDKDAKDYLLEELLTIHVQVAAGDTKKATGEYVEPVQLQIVCQSLWANLPPEVEVIKRDLIQKLADVEKALKDFYERTIEKAQQSFYERAIEKAKGKRGVSESDLRGWFNDKLITPAGTRGTVFQGKEQTEGIPNPVVDVLEAHHIVRAERRAGARWYELTHDRLIEPIRTSNAEAKDRKKAKLCYLLMAAIIAICIISAGLLIHQPSACSLTVTPVEAYGSVKRTPDQPIYERDDEVTLEAVPNTGYRFENWSGDLSGSANPATLVMDGAKSVTANFVRLKAGDVETNSIGMKLVYIPAGSFRMGSSSSAAQLARERDEFPQHQVHLSEDFWMGQTEVTQGQYKLVMNAQPWSGKKNVQEDANNPAVYVTWYEAVRFCQMLSQREGETYRLPTEAEWEYACRAGTTTRFSFGNEDSALADYAWFAKNSLKINERYAHPVGQKKPNPWGLYDMHGNVYEWCSDYYDKDYYSKSPSVDPKGPTSGTARSLRGSSWDLTGSYLRCSYRPHNKPDLHIYNVGFRVVRQPKTPYSLIAEAVDGSVQKDPDKALYNPDETVVLRAVPDPNYGFKEWSGDLSGRTNPAPLIMDDDKSVTARFVKIYSLTANAVDGFVTKDPDQVRHDDGETVTLEAVPDPEYSFTHWSGDLSGSVNPTTITMDSDKSVTAHFAPKLKTYNLTATAVNGSVMKSPDQAVYKHGEEVTLVAVPDKGYRFVNWSGDLSGRNDTTTLLIDDDKRITANFALKTYSLTATAVGGSVTKSPDQASYNHGETVTLEAVPDPNYRFKEWSGDLSGKANPATITMDSDKSVTAHFALKLKTHSLTATAVGGSVTKSPDQVRYDDGETVTLEAVPNTGYHFTHWSGDLSGSTNPAAITMDSDKSVTAHFGLKPKTYGLTATAVGGSVTMSPDQASYRHGETVTLEAVPNPEYSFTRWSGDLSGRTNPATITMDSDKSVTAHFVPKPVVTNSIGMKLVYIPAGSFRMGSSDSEAQLAGDYDLNEASYQAEFPQHPVRLSEGFRMAQTEVTQGQYFSVMNARPWSGQSFVQADANNPAVCVSWSDAVEFCRELSQREGQTYRLPTEAEWEYACRAGTTARFSFGDSDSSLGDYAWFVGNTYKVGQKYPHPVRRKKPNPWGLYDMHGNVWEWCRDWYDRDYYSKSLEDDPDGPLSGATRCLRGGSWLRPGYGLRCSNRFHVVPVYRYLSVGFRVVRSQ